MENRRWNIKQLCLLISIVLIATVTAGGTLAYITTHTEGLVNEFDPVEVTCSINETMSQDNLKKTNVSVTNTGDTDAYIRATYVVTWQDSNGIAAKPVAEGDYIVEFAKGTAWKKGDDGYWYYTKPVTSGAETEVLITSCEPVKNGPEGYTLHVEIIADAVQSSPNEAVTEAWGASAAAMLNN